MTKSGTGSVVGVHEAKTHLSRLLERVRCGEEITIERRGEPVARLVQVAPRQRPIFDTDRGRVVIHDDFDELPDGFAETFGIEDSDS